MDTGAADLSWDQLTVGQRVERLRYELGTAERPLSHDRLAARLGTSRQTVISWEKHNAQPRQDYRQKLGEIAERPATDFLTPSPKVTPDRLEQRLASLDDKIGRLSQKLDRLLEQLDPESVLAAAELGAQNQEIVRAILDLNIRGFDALKTSNDALAAALDRIERLLGGLADEAETG